MNALTRRAKLLITILPCLMALGLFLGFLCSVDSPLQWL